MAKIAVLAPLPAEVVAGQLPDEHEVVTVPDDADPAAACHGADVCVADWRATHRVAGPVIDALAGSCRLVQIPAAGLDSVDVDACAEAGIPVASCAGLNAGAVAEWCVFGAIAALRGLAGADRGVREGRWEQLAGARYELAGRTVGLVGMGDVGRAAARRFAPFDVDLRYWTRNRRPASVEDDLGITWSDLDALLPVADVLVLAIALTPQTHHLLDAERLAGLQPTAVVVNAARGEIVDEEALAAALQEGRLHGAAVDVFSTEPPPDDHPLLSCETVVLSPHVAGATAESAGRIFERSIGNVVRVLGGGEPEGRVV